MKSVFYFHSSFALLFCYYSTDPAQISPAITVVANAVLDKDFLREGLSKYFLGTSMRFKKKI